MKKVNKKGFVLAETIVISVVVITALVIIYTQFISVDNSYYRSFNYNNVNDLYLANQIKTFINNSNGSSIYSIIDDENLYIDITECDYFIEYMYCENLIDAINAKRVIITKNDTTNLISNIESYDFSEAMKSYIKNSKSNEDGYRIIVEFNDSTIAGLELG